MHPLERIQSTTGNRVLVRTEPRETEVGGVIVTAGKEKNRWARVLKVPDKIRKRTRTKKEIEFEPDVQPGDRVFLLQWAHHQGGRQLAEEYSDDGMLMLVDYDWIGGVER